jgi:hypothetical protein
MICFYLRVFPNAGMRWACFVTIAFIITSSVVVLFLQIFQCSPINFLWDGWKDSAGFGSYRCLNITHLTYSAAACFMVQDLAILILPVPLVYKLNVSTRSKIAIFFMFSLGGFVLLTSCIRLRYIVQFTVTQNPTWDYTDIMIWSGLEINISIIVTTLPSIRLLIKRYVPNIFRTIVTNHSGTRLKSPSDSNIDLEQHRNLSQKSNATRSALSSKSPSATHPASLSDTELGNAARNDILSKNEDQSTSHHYVISQQADRSEP